MKILIISLIVAVVLFTGTFTALLSTVLTKVKLFQEKELKGY